MLTKDTLVRNNGKNVNCISLYAMLRKVSKTKLRFAYNIFTYQTTKLKYIQMASRLEQTIWNRLSLILTLNMTQEQKDLISIPLRRPRLNFYRVKVDCGCLITKTVMSFLSLLINCTVPES